MLDPNKKVSLSFKALESSIDLSSYESPRWHLLIEDCFVYINNLFSVATFINYVS